MEHFSQKASGNKYSNVFTQKDTQLYINNFGDNFLLLLKSFIT